jgi:hypothetical protein
MPVLLNCFKGQQTQAGCYLPQREKIDKLRRKGAAIQPVFADEECSLRLSKCNIEV